MGIICEEIERLQTQKQPPEVFCKKAVLKDFAIFLKAPVLDSLFNKVALHLPINKDYFEEYLQTAASANWKKRVDRNFAISFKKLL